MKTKNFAVLLAILAAALYAINVPFSKLLMTKVSPTVMASFLYLGAGMGMFIYTFVLKVFGKNAIKEPLTRKELPYTIAMVLLDIAAPIFLMFGIMHTSSASVSLLNNFEIVATSVIAFVIFKEAVSKRLFSAIILVVISSVILTFEGTDGFIFGTGSLFVLAACVCWGFENNCTKMLSKRSSVEIVIIKGIFSGLGSLAVAFITGESLPNIKLLVLVLFLGFVAYGLSINFYIMAQKHIGAAKTSAFYSVAPFLGVAFSMIFVGETPSLQFHIAFAVMVAATALMVKDTLK